MYLHEAVNLPQNWGVSQKAQEGVNQKPLKMCQKISFLAEFPPFLNNTMKSVTFMIHMIHISHPSLGSDGQETSQSQPKIILSP